MKAILVVDVNNIDQVNRCRVTVCEDKAQYMIDNVKIKPMPMKKEKLELMDFIREADINTGFRGGWNACIDELLGETE